MKQSTFIILLVLLIMLGLAIVGYVSMYGFVYRADVFANLTQMNI